MANVGFYEPLAEFRKRDNFDVVFRAALDDIAGTDPYTLPVYSELSIGWVDPWVGLGWVGSHKMDPWTTLRELTARVDG